MKKGERFGMIKTSRFYESGQRVSAKELKKRMKEYIKEFDGVGEIVYAADTKTHELLFLNKAGLEAFGYDSLTQVLGRKCYEVLQGMDFPCAICGNDRLNDKEYLERTHENPVTGRKYRLKSKLIPWDGERTVRMEIADDITKSDMQEIEIRIRQRAKSEKIVMDCIKMMYSSVETDEAINNTLEMLGNYLKGERVYVFSIHGRTMDNTYEWCAEGVSREIASLQNLPVTLIDRWLPYFKKDECVIIEDIEQIRETSPEEYEVLKVQNIRSLITVPLIEKENLAGYFGIDNPWADNLHEISDILKMLAYFFQSLLERKNREDYLKKIGFSDGMTGALNRNAFIRDVMLDNSRELLTAGCFFIDINGLKKTNDTYGHEAGDKLIRQIYGIICKVVGKHPVYRLGGDEFVVLCQNISIEDMGKMESGLKEELGGKNGCSAAVGQSFLENPGDLSLLMEEADKKMYQNKEDYYKNQGAKS